MMAAKTRIPSAKKMVFVYIGKYFRVFSIYQLFASWYVCAWNAAGCRGIRAQECGKIVTFFPVF